MNGTLSPTDADYVLVSTDKTSQIALAERR